MCVNIFFSFVPNRNFTEKLQIEKKYYLKNDGSFKNLDIEF